MSLQKLSRVHLGAFALVAVAACGASDAPGDGAVQAPREQVGERRAALETVTEDFSTGTNGGPWPAQWSTQSAGSIISLVATAIPPLPDTGFLARLNGWSGGYSNHWLLGRAPTLDSDQSIDIAFNSNTTFASLAARRSAPDTYYGVLVGTNPSVDRIRLVRGTPGDSYHVLKTAGQEPLVGAWSAATPNAWYRLRLKVTQTSAGALLQSKLWQGTEPAGWTLEYTDPPPPANPPNPGLTALQTTPGYNGIGASAGTSNNKFIYYDNYQLEGAPPANVCTSDAACGNGRYCSQAGECRPYGATCSTNAMCGSGQSCQESQCACPVPANGCLLNGGPAPTLADLMADFPSLNYRKVTYARDTTDYFALPTPSPIVAPSTGPVSPELKRSNHFILNVPTARAVSLTVDVGNTTVPTNPFVDVLAYDATGTTIKRGFVDSKYPARLQSVVDLGTLAAGNYEIDVAPRDPALTYTVKAADPGIVVSLKGGADLATAGQSVYFYVPAEAETAFLLGAFDPAVPVQFFPPETTLGSPDQRLFFPSSTPVTASVITPKVYALDTKGKPGVWKAVFRTTSSRAHFLNLPDVFSFDPRSIIASKRIRTAMSSATGGSPTAVTSPNLKYNNRFAFHVSASGTPAFSIGTGFSASPPPPLAIKLLDSNGTNVAGGPFSVTPTGTVWPLPISSLQPGDYELHVLNPSIYNSYSVTVPPNVPFVSVDGYGLGNVRLDSYRAFFTVPTGTTSVFFAAKPVGVPIDVYNPAGAFLGEPIARGNFVYEIQNTTPGTWAINLKGDIWSDIRLLNVPQIISFNSNLHETTGPGGIITCVANADCPNGRVCGRDNGREFGLDAAADVCWLPPCGTAQAPPGSCGSIYSECGLACSLCYDGLKSAGESDVDCGGPCAPCGVGKQCNDDCAPGLACGTNNGGYFGLARSKRVCWQAGPCGDGVDSSECGTPTSICGQYCGGVVPCTVGDANSVCPGGEVCKAGLGQAYGVADPAVCVDASCPSDDPTKCGTSTSLCGTECVCTPNCSGATPANPKDGCGGECRNICADGQACCTDNLHCATGSVCAAQPEGMGICRPASCAFQHLAPPLCGSANSPCGATCPACTPDCNGRQCGVDSACGTSCGTCDADSFCTGDGQCSLKANGDPPVMVPDGNGGQIEIKGLPAPPTSAVGAVAGKFSVSDQGTALYNVPIEVPPGRAGMEPVLSLQYSATKANGQAGVGWQLEGLSQVTRCPRTFALDGYASPVKNDTTDRFCIDGKRLETVGGSAAYGTEGAEYRTLVDTFTKVVSRNDFGNGFQLPPFAGIQPAAPTARGPDYFQVWTKDGRLLTYGRTRDSLVMGRDGTRYTWLLNEVKDRAGNTMTFRYSSLQAAVPAAAVRGAPTIVRPASIYYAGYGGTAGDREVRFEYEDRTDPQVSFLQGGTPLMTTTRLKRVVTFVRGAPVKNYRLDYIAGSLSQVNKIFECRKDQSTEPDCKPPTEFTYEQESGFQQAPAQAFFQGDMANAGQLDMNGDGLPDFLITTVNVGGVPAQPALQAVSIGADIAVGIGSYALGGVGGLAVNLGWTLIKGPLFGLFAKHPKITLSRDILKGNGTRVRPTDLISGISGLDCQGAASAFLDYDQDGKDDVVSPCGPYTVRVFRSIGDGNFESYPSSAPVQILPAAIGLPSVPAPLLYDVNGDSLQDLVSCFDASTLEVRLRAGPDQAFGSAIQLKGESITGPQGTITSRIPFCGNAVPTRQIVDVDGDGTPELLARFSRYFGERLAFGPREGWFALRFSGAGATPTIEWQRVAFPDSGNSALGQDMMFADVNGDGLNDVWRTKDAEATVWLNTGGGFLTQTMNRPRPVLEFRPLGVLSATAITDYDADGRLDILEHWLGRGAGFDPEYNVALRPNSLASYLNGGLADDLKYRNPTTNVVSGGRYSTVGDLDGDGNADLFGANDAIFYGSGLHNLLLSSVKDGLGNIVHISYDGANTYQTDCTEAKQWPEMCLKTMKGLVGTHTEGFADPTNQSGEVVERTYSYSYWNGRMNVTGHGWLGFDKRTVTESVLDQRRTVTIKFEPPTRYTPGGILATSATQPYLYPLAGLPKTVTTDLGFIGGGDVDPEPLETALHTRRSVVTNFWAVKLSADSRPFPVLSRTKTESFSRPVGPLDEVPFDEDGDLRTSCGEQHLDFDGYGNSRHDLKYCWSPEAEATLESTETFTTFEPNRSAWIISNPERISTTSSRYGEGDPQTQVVDPEYDILGQLKAVTRDPLGSSPSSPRQNDAERTTYFRDSYGNVERIVEDVATGEAARTTRVVYGSDGTFPIQLTRVTETADQNTIIRFDPRFGRVVIAVDPNQIVARSSYDDFGKITDSVGGNGATVYSYASIPAGAVATPAGTTHPRFRVVIETKGTAGTFGGKVVQLYDNYGRTVSSTSLGLGGVDVVSEQAYDARGRLVGSTLPHSDNASASPTTYKYDYLDRVTMIENADGSFSERKYASGVSLAPGHQNWLDELSCSLPDPTRCAVDIEFRTDTHYADEETKENVVIKDYAGLVIRSIDGENVDTAAKTSNYNYGPFDRLRQIRDNGNAVTVFDIDDYGRVKNYVDPDVGVSQYTYNGFGELKTATDPKGQLRTHTYDVLGRLRTIVDNSGTSQWIYDQGVSAIGQLSETISPPTLENPSGQHVLYEYEATTSVRRRGLLKSTTYVIDNATYTVGMRYDDLGRPDTVDYPNTGSGTPIRAKYRYEDASGALVELRENGSGAPGALGRSIWRIDSAFQGQLVQQETFGNGAVSTFGYSADRRWVESINTTVGGQTVQSLDYTHHGNGQVHERITPQRTQEYLYDELARLRTLTTVSGASSSLKRFAYDVYGNLKQNDSLTNDFLATQPHLLERVGANAYRYDLNGNVSSREGPDVPGQTQTFTYTPFDLPRNIVSGTVTPRLTQFEYTADGTRVVRRDPDSTRHFASELYQRLISSTGGTLEERFRLVGGPGVVAEIVRVPGSEKTLYFHPDHLGTPDTISDSAGAVLGQEYDSFGDLVGGAPPLNQDPTRIGFTGQQQDNDLRLVDMGGRIYDPLAGRFMTADPIMQAPFWSQGLNRYSYVFNDPINATDPSGFMSVSEVAGGMAPAVIGAGIVGGAYAATHQGIGLVGAAGGLSSALQNAWPGVGAALNVITDVAFSPFRGSSGGSYSMQAPSAAATSNPNRMAGGNALTQLAPPGVQERPANLSLFAPERGALAEIPCRATPEECRQRGRQMVLDAAFMGAPGGVVIKGAAAAESILGRMIGWLFGRGAAAGAEAVKVGEYTLTRTVASKLAERPYLSSPNALREIMAAGKPVADPGGVAGALRWDVAGAFRGSAGTWELVVEPKTKMILHWLFKSAPKAAP